MGNTYYLFEKDKLIDNKYLINQIENNYDVNHLIHNMNLIYEIFK